MSSAETHTLINILASVAKIGSSIVRFILDVMRCGNDQYTSLNMRVCKCTRYNLGIDYKDSRFHFLLVILMSIYCFNIGTLTFHFNFTSFFLFCKIYHVPYFSRSRMDITIEKIGKKYLNSVIKISKQAIKHRIFRDDISRGRNLH